MTDSCADRYFYTENGLKIPSNMAIYHSPTQDLRVVSGRAHPGPGQIHVSALSLDAQLEYRGMLLRPPSKLPARRVRPLMGPALVAVARTHSVGLAVSLLDSLSPAGRDRTTLVHSLCALLDRDPTPEDTPENLLSDALDQSCSLTPDAPLASRLARLRPVPTAPAPLNISRYLDTSTPESTNYYAKLTSQHFGAHPTASNFTQLSNPTEMLHHINLTRGLDGDDRDLLMTLGAAPSALLDTNACRYVLFSTPGNLGIIPASTLDPRAVVRLVAEKPGIPLSLVLTGYDSSGAKIALKRPSTDVATAIFGPDDQLWTAHPGLPVRPRSSTLFEDAGYRESDTFTVEDLLSSRSPAGRALFARLGLDPQKPSPFDLLKAPLVT